MQIRFDDKAVAVSGVGHGFGRCIAETFAQLGARVFGCETGWTGSRSSPQFVADSLLEGSGFELSVPLWTSWSLRPERACAQVGCGQ